MNEALKNLIKSLEHDINVGKQESKNLRKTAEDWEEVTTEKIRIVRILRKELNENE